MRWLRRILPVVFLLLVLGLAIREVRGLDFHAMRAVLQSLGLGQLLIIQGISALGVLSMCLYDWRAAREFSIKLPPRELLRMSWIANTFNNLIGFSGLAGSGIRMLLLGSAGVDSRRAAAFSALIIASVPVGLSVLCWPVLLSGVPGLDRLPVPAWSAWLALVVFTVYLPIYVLVLHKGGFKRISRMLPALSGVSLVSLIAISAMDWLIAAFVAWTALAFSGAQIGMAQFLTGFAFASALGILSLIPGGLGVFDAALVILLSPFTQGPEHIVSGVLVYRVCYYLVPWVVAIYLGAGDLILPRIRQDSPVVRYWRESPLPALFLLPLDLVASLGIRVMAYLTLAGGVILLASSASPALSDRLAILRSHVPLAAIEVSHFLSVATGVLLIALARGIASQVRSAYHLTQWLLMAGALVSLLKGIDYEEALVLLGVALLLRRQRDHFYRESYPLLSPRSLLWLAGMIIAVIGYAWLGYWAHGNLPLGWGHLSRFTPPLEASRFARGLLISAAAATGFIAWSFFRNPKHKPPQLSPQELTEAETVLNRFGGSEFANLLFLGDKHLLWSPDRESFVQYGQFHESLIALGDPCGNPDAFDAAIVAFRDHADRHDLTPCFYEVSEVHMHHYHDAGFALFKIGEAALVEVADFTTAGKHNESLRYSINRAKRAGAEFQLMEQPLDDAVWRQLRTISNAWLKKHNAAEKGFSLGSYNEAYLRRSPIAVVKVGSDIVAFANLMPDFGRHVDLGIDLMRHSPEAPPGTMDLLLAELIMYAKKQGYQNFNLGMAPLGGVGVSRYARAGEKVARLAFEFGNRFYNYKGLRSYKEKFNPRWVSAYLAYPILTPLPKLLIEIAALIAGGYGRILSKRD